MPAVSWTRRFPALASLLALCVIAPGALASSRIAGYLCGMDVDLMATSQHGYPLEPQGQLAVRLVDQKTATHQITLSNVGPYTGIFMYARDTMTGMHRGSWTFPEGYLGKGCGGTSGRNSTFEHTMAPRFSTFEFTWRTDASTPIGTMLVLEAMVCISLRQWFLVPPVEFTVGHDGYGLDMSFQYTTSSINFFRSDFLLYTMWIFFLILALIGFGVRFIIEEQERHQIQRSLQEKRRITIKRAMSKREGRSGTDTGSDMKSLPPIRDDDRSRNLSRQPSTGRREIPPAAEGYGESRRISPRDNDRSPPSGGLARKPSQREGGYQRSPDRDPFADPPLRRADSASRSRKPTPYRLAEPDYGDASRRVPSQRRPMDDESRQFSAKPSQVFTVELPASFATDVTGDGRAPRSRSVPRGDGLQRSGSGSNGGQRSRSMARPASGVERATSRRYYD